MTEPLQDEIIGYLSNTGDGWWSARGVAIVLSQAAAEIEATLELCWKQGLLLRKRGVGGRYEYHRRPRKTS